MGQTLTALGIVLGAVVLLRWLFRASGFEGRLRGGRSGLRVVTSCALGPRQRIHVVEVESERLLVGATDRSVNLLRRLPPREAASSDEEIASPEGKENPPRTKGPLWSRLRRLTTSGAFFVLACAVILAATSAVAQESVTSPPSAPTLTIPIDVNAMTKPERISSTLEILALLTLLSVAPSILLMGTCFTRVVIVLALLRQAVGIQQLPPNQVLVGLAVAITLFVMAPVGRDIRDQALDPYVARQIDASTASVRAIAPVRNFLLAHTREKDLDLFVSLSDREPPEDPNTVSLAVLLPSYILSELRTAFEIGFTIFLPFLIVDLVIASMLISMQMIVLPPMLISLPFKIMLFVLVDGWNLVVHSLVSSLS